MSDQKTANEIVTRSLQKVFELLPSTWELENYNYYEVKQYYYP